MQSKKIVNPTMRLIFGIIFIVVSVIVAFQSLAVMAAFSLASNDAASGDGAAGIVVALLMLILGIVFIVTRKNVTRGVKITGYIIGFIGAILAIGGSDYFSDLMIYGTLLLVGTVLCNLNLSKVKEDNSSKQTDKKSVSNTDEILKFKELLDSGAITQEEFDKQKKRLLDL